uniref:Uncharacterized protein n=1 Tax=Arundo donax TaxID=35708 RepID=A0A0A9G637_ARUDO
MLMAVTDVDGLGHRRTRRGPHLRRRALRVRRQPRERVRAQLPLRAAEGGGGDQEHHDPQRRRNASPSRHHPFLAKNHLPPTQS